MKKSFSGVIALLAGAFAVYSQGSVTMTSYGDSHIGTYIYVSLGNTKLGGLATGPVATTANFASETANGDDWTVAIYGAAGANDSPSALSQLMDWQHPNQLVTANLADGTTDETVGTWYSGAIANVPGTFNGQTATVQLRAWYNDGGTINSYDAAFAASVPTGFSSTGNVTLGGYFQGNAHPPSPGADLPNGMGNITLAVVAPEPNTIALGVIGTSAFLLRFRRKVR